MQRTLREIASPKAQTFDSIDAMHQQRSLAHHRPLGLEVTFALGLAAALCARTAAAQSSPTPPSAAAGVADASQLVARIDGAPVSLGAGAHARVAGLPQRSLAPRVFVRGDAAVVVWDTRDGVRLRFVSLAGTPTSAVEDPDLEGTHFVAGDGGMVFQDVFAARDADRWTLFAVLGSVGVGTGGAIAQEDRVRRERSQGGWTTPPPGPEDEGCDPPEVYSQMTERAVVHAATRTGPLALFRFRASESHNEQPLTLDAAVGPERLPNAWLGAADDGFLVETHTASGRGTLVEVGRDGRARGEIRPNGLVSSCVATAHAWVCLPEYNGRPRDVIQFVPRPGGASVGVTSVRLASEPSVLAPVRDDLVACVIGTQLVLIDAAGHRSPPLALGPGRVGAVSPVPNGLLIARERGGRVELLAVHIDP